MDDLQVQGNNTQGNCDGFVDPVKGSQPMRTIMISTLKITIDQGHSDEERWRFVNGCNMGENCMNPDCWFGAVIRNKKRAESRIRKEQANE